MHTRTRTHAVLGELFKGVESSEERLVHLICHLVNTAHSLINAETGASQSESIHDLTLSPSSLFQPLSIAPSLPFKALLTSVSRLL
ncbi:hypothetical protein QQF64_022372 [Cirrhinus molitorella]|uniref:Uncharacterized protein n=1 Tax=Cirrhinus molitorella TaxID=172907 RepID=A0ABR3LBJ3_9TELE